jgi:hypothetical protein
MSSHRGYFGREYGFLKEEFAVLETKENLLEKKLQSKSKISRKRLQDVKAFEEIESSYEALLKEITEKTSKLKETFTKLEKAIEEYYLTH